MDTAVRDPKAHLETSAQVVASVSDDLVGVEPSFWNRQSWQRLASSIAAYDHELGSRAAESEAMENAKKALQKARGFLKDGDIDTAWKLFHCACRLELLHMDHKQLSATAVAMKSEAEKKLSGWRKDAISKILEEYKSPEPGNENADDLAERLFLATRIRDEHYDNEAYKTKIRKGAILKFAIILIITVFSLIGLSWWKKIPPGPEEQTIMLVYIALFGLLGATVSATIATTKDQTSARIPELASSSQVTFLRLFMGPASALILYFVAKSSIVSNLFKFDLDDTGILVLAIAAGFSERLVLRVVEKFAGNE